MPDRMIHGWFGRGMKSLSAIVDTFREGSGLRIRFRTGCNGRNFTDLRDKAIPMPSHSLDIPWGGGIVPQGTPKLTDRMLDCADLALTAPNRLQEFGLGHDTMPVLNKKFKRAEWLRCQFDLVGPNREAPKVNIEPELADTDDGLISSSCICAHTRFRVRLSGFSALLQFESAQKHSILKGPDWRCEPV